MNLPPNKQQLAEYDWSKYRAKLDYIDDRDVAAQNVIVCRKR